MERLDKRNVKSFIIKIILSFILLLFAVCPSISTVEVKAEDKTAHIVIEHSTNRILYKYNAFQKMYPASTTKILTAITVLENCDTESVVEIPSIAVGIEGSSIYLKAGEKYKVIDLLYGLMLRSGNDSAVALANFVGGSVENFVMMMNNTAKKIGANFSNFTNPHGLHDDRHYTTAFDLAMITSHALRNDTFAKIVSSTSHEFCKEDGTKCIFYNKNKMLTSFDGANGVKTGFTKKSGRCLVSSAKRNNMQLVSVVLNEYSMWDKSKELLQNAFSNYSLCNVFEKGMIFEEKFENQLKKGKVKNDFLYPLSKTEKEKLRYQTIFTDSKNGEVGKVKAYIDNYLLFSQKLYSIDI